jgi:hypothetical protein
MNRKLLGLALAISFLAILIAPVMAGKGQNKVTFEFTFADQVYYVMQPPKEAGQNIFLLLAFDLGEDGVVHLEIGGEDYYSYGTGYVDESDFAYYSEMRYDVHKRFDETGKDFTTIHWWYTLDFGGDDVITITCNGLNFNTDPATSRANIVGFGTGIFEDIQLEGTAGNDETGLITHWGTIMGWPEMP